MSATTVSSGPIQAIYMCGHIKDTTSLGPAKSSNSSKEAPIVVRTTSEFFLTTDVCPMCSITGTPVKMIPFGRIQMATQLRSATLSLRSRLSRAETRLGISEEQKLIHPNEPRSHGLDRSAVIVMADFARSVLSQLQYRSFKVHSELPHLQREVFVQAIEDLEKCTFKVRRLEEAAKAYAEGRYAAAGTFLPILKEHIKHSLSLAALTSPDLELVLEDCRTKEEKADDSEPLLPSWLCSDASSSTEDQSDCESQSECICTPFSSLTPTAGSPPPYGWDNQDSLSSGSSRPSLSIDLSQPEEYFARRGGVRESFSAIDCDSRPFYHWPSRRDQGNVPLLKSRRGSYGPSWPPVPPSPSALPLPPMRML